MTPATLPAELVARLERERVAQGLPPRIYSTELLELLAAVLHRARQKND